MQRLVRVRLGTVAAVVVTSAIAVSGLAVPANAAVVKTTCTTVTITTKGVGTLKGCNNAAATGSSAKLKVATAKSPYVATFTWNKAGTITKANLTYNLPKAGAKPACKKGVTEVDVAGTVTSSTGKAKTAIPKGAKVSAKLCLTGKTSLTLAAKTKFTL